MEDFGNKMLEMLQYQQSQQLELIKHLEESRQRDKKELEEERKREKLEFREQLMTIQKLQLEQQDKSDQKIELLAQTLRNRNDDDENSFSQSAIWAAIDTFHHEPENGLTFEAYFRRFEDTFKIDCSQWADAKK